MRYRHIILDRDGVLNVEDDAGTPITVERWFWHAGSLQALVLLTRSGLRLSVATNQACIGRGQVTRAAVDAVHERLVAEAKDAGAEISGVYLCPHAPAAGCTCRKPAPGLIREAIRASGISASETLLVGDDLRDLLAARAAGIDAVLVRTGKGHRTEALPEAHGFEVFDSLLQFAEHLARR